MAWDNQQSNAYLAANPDVYAAVQQGQFPSAEAHYQRHGMNEARRGVPMQGDMPTMQGGAFSAMSPVAPRPIETGGAPGAFGEINTGSLGARFGDTGMTIGQYSGQNPVIARGLASGALDASDFQQTGAGSFVTSPRVAELERQAMQQQQMGSIESRLRGVDSRYDLWKKSSDPRDQRNLRDLINSQASQGWAPQMYGLPAEGVFAGTNQSYRPGETSQQQPQTGAFGGNSGFQQPQQFGAGFGVASGMSPMGGRFYGGPYNQPQSQNFGMNGNSIPRGQGTYSQMRPSVGYPAAPRPMGGGSSPFGSTGAFGGANPQQQMYDTMSAGRKPIESFGQFQPGQMSANFSSSGQPQMPQQQYGAFGGQQTGFVR